ncbi:MAG: hypothetical protein LBR08_12245 [Bacteroidales bacterium]|jgi:hypothetical protein|nr:hypothetical protein [Bacteroidales bacterium]
MMNKFGLNWAKALMIALMLGTFACEKSEPLDPNEPVPDPKGTITANISEVTEIRIIDGAGIECGYIGWTFPDNFDLAGTLISICDLGAMHGLGNIARNLSSTAFTAPAAENRSVACEPGHGYIIRVVSDSYTVYVRLYVVETIVEEVSDINGVHRIKTGAKVQYQYPF